MTGLLRLIPKKRATDCGGYQDYDEKHESRDPPEDESLRQTACLGISCLDTARHGITTSAASTVYVVDRNTATARGKSEALSSNGPGRRIM